MAEAAPAAPASAPASPAISSSATPTTAGSGGTSPSTTGSTAPAPAGSSATPAPNPLSEAGRTLSLSAREARKVRMREEAAAKEKPAAEPTKEKEPDPKAASSDAAAQANASPSATPADSAGALSTKADPGEDPAFALLREDRRVKGEVKKLQAEREKLEADRATLKDIEPVITAVREARTKGDHLGAAHALGYKTQEEKSALLMALVEDLKEPEEFDPSKLPTIIEQQVEAKLKATREAEQKAREDAEAQTAAEKAAAKAHTEKAVTSAQAHYMNAATQFLNANVEKFPQVQRLFASLGDDAGEVISRRLNKRIQEGHAANPTGYVVPEPDAALLAYEAELAALNPTPAAVAPKPAATVTSEWKADAGKPDPDHSGDSLDTIRARRKAAMREDYDRRQKAG